MKNKEKYQEHEEHQYQHQKQQQIPKQILKYLFVGGTSALFELLLFVFMLKSLGINLQISNVIATGTATALNFLMNRSWSFKSSSNFSRSLALYLLLICFNLMFTTYTITIMVNRGIVDVFAKFITMGVVIVWNFFIYKKVVFK